MYRALATVIVIACYHGRVNDAPAVASDHRLTSVVLAGALVGRGDEVARRRRVPR
jgi:hypothetical protein